MRSRDPIIDRRVAVPCLPFMSPPQHRRHIRGCARSDDDDDSGVPSRCLGTPKYILFTVARTRRIRRESWLPSICSPTRSRGSAIDRVASAPGGVTTRRALVTRSTPGSTARSILIVPLPEDLPPGESRLKKYSRAVDGVKRRIRVDERRRIRSACSRRVNK